MEQKRELILFGCYWYLKSAKRSLNHPFLCWVDVRQTSVDDSFTAVFPLKKKKQDTFVILTYF